VKNDNSFGKHALLVFSGDKITPEQAGEIIVRTGLNQISGKDKDNLTLVKILLGMPTQDDNEIEDFEEFYEEFEQAYADLHGVPLYHMTNRQIIANGYLGLNGWLDWDGNIGGVLESEKWPVVSDIALDLYELGKAFPFLNLTVQVFTLNDDLSVNFTVAGEFTLSNGGDVCRVNESAPLLIPEDIERMNNEVAIKMSHGMPGSSTLPDEIADMQRLIDAIDHIHELSKNAD
jgi:hypothetical protein